MRQPAMLLVGDAKLAGMNNPITLTHQSQEIKICSAADQAEFNKNPAKFMKRLADAEN